MDSAFVIDTAQAQTITQRFPGLAAFVFVISAALLIAALYLAYNQMHISPAERLPIDLSHIHRYPWWDMTENVMIGFNLANGKRFEHDTVVTHMPGIYQYLAVFYKLTGLADGTPSPQLLASCYVVAVLAVTFFNLACLFAALRVLGFAFFSAALTSSFILGIIAFSCDALFPMSENLIPFIFFLQFACFIKILWQQKSQAETYIYAAWALTLLPLVNLLIGLTIAPSVAFLWLATFILTLWEIKKEGASALLCATKNKMLWIPIVLAVALIGIEAASLDFPALWFWNYDVNKSHVTMSPLYVLQNAFLRQWDAFLYYQVQYIGRNVSGAIIIRLATILAVLRFLMSQHFVGGTIIELALAFILFGILYQPRNQNRHNRGDYIRILVLMITAFGALMLSYWRYSVGYKGEDACGIAWAIVLWSAGRHWSWLRQGETKFFLKHIVVLGSVAAALFVWYIGSLDIYAQALPPRPAALDIANVCRYRSSEACRCVQLSMFRPQIFLNQDVRQCKERYATFALGAFKNPVVSGNLVADLDRKDMAFIIYPAKMIDIYPTDRDPRVMRAFYGGGMHCDPYIGGAKLCYNP